MKTLPFNSGRVSICAALLGILLTSGCGALLKDPVYQPERKSRFGTPDVAIRAPTNAALFTLLVRRVNVSRSNGLAWVSRRSLKDYANYNVRIKGLLGRHWQFRLIDQEDILDSDAYLAGRFPIREEFFMNPELLPIVREEGDRDLMLRLGRALETDYFVTVLVDHRITKIVGFSPRLEGRVVLHLYNYFGGHVATYEIKRTEVAQCPAEKGRADLVCEDAINAALDRAMTRVFKDLGATMQKVRIQAPRERKRRRRPRPQPQPKPVEESVEADDLVEPEPADEKESMPSGDQKSEANPTPKAETAPDNGASGR